MLLKDKVAIIYGGGGSVGGAVARAFAREGARVFLAGRTPAKLDVVARDITGRGGKAETAQVDALDRAAVDRHADAVAATAGRIDISFNAIELGETQGKHLTETPHERFSLPVATAMATHFYTGTAAARHMAKNRSGVIMAITANAGRTPFPNTGGFGVACAAIEALCRQFAVELGPQGIRVVCLMSAGSPDAAGVSAAFDLHAKNQGISREEFDRQAGLSAMLRHLPNLAEVADAAAIMASGYAGAMTGTVANVTCGQIAV